MKETNQLAQRLLEEPSICAACNRFGSEPVSRDERTVLIALGLVEAKPDSIAPGGQVFILSSMGRLASRVGRLNQLIEQGVV